MKNIARKYKKQYEDLLQANPTEINELKENLERISMERTQMEESHAKIVNDLKNELESLKSEMEDKLKELREIGEERGRMTGVL